MTHTPLSPLLRIRNILADTVAGTTPEVDSCSVTHGLDGEETGMVSIPTGPGDTNTAAAAWIAAGGGPSGTSTLVPSMLELSLDGGTGVDFRKMVDAPTLTLDSSTGAFLHEAGNGLWQGYTGTLVDHVTFHQIAFADLVDGAAGSITLPSGSGIGTPALLGNLKGYLRTIPGPPYSGSPTWAGQTRLQFGVYVDTSIAALAVDADEYGSPIDKAVDTAIAAVRGLQVNADAPGLHGHYVVDSSDGSTGNLGHVYDGTIPGPAVVIGVAGHASGLTFMDGASPTNPAQAQLIDPVERQIQLADIEAVEALIGGVSNHGLPDAASITGLVCINTGTSGTAWNASLLLIAAHDSQGGGGVYYWHEGTAYASSQQLTVRDLTLDIRATTPYLYAATTQGVYRAIGTLSGTQTPPQAQRASSYGVAHTTSNWERIGGDDGSTGNPKRAGLVSDCRKVIADNGVIVTHATTGNVVGLFMHPAISGDTKGNTGGFDGWSSLHPSNAIVDFAYTQSTDELVFSDANDAIAVTFHVGVQINGGTVHRVATPNGSTITGIDKVPGGYIVRTLDGSLGLYFLASGGATAMVAIGSGLVDASGNAVTVNRIVPYPDPTTAGGVAIAGQPIFGFACTDYGIFTATAALNLGTWAYPGVQTGLTDQNILTCVAGKQQMLINRLATRVAAATDYQLFLSHSDGLYFGDELADKVDLGAYFYAAALTSPTNTGAAPFPPTDIVALVTSTGGQYVGTLGSNWVLPTALALPPNFAWVAPLDERNKRSFRLVNLASDAPYFNAHPGELPEIEATASTDATTASTRLAWVHLSRLKECSRIQTILTVHSTFSYAEHLLRTLRPTQTVTVTLDRAGWGLVYSAATFYVLKHTISKQSGEEFCRTETELGTIMRPQPPTDPDFAAGVGYALGKLARGTRGRSK